MTKLILIVLACVVLVGCEMPNDQIIAECKKCREAGLTPVTVHNGFTEKVVGVQCMPKVPDPAQAERMRKLEESNKKLEERVDAVEKHLQHQGARFK